MKGKWKFLLVILVIVSGIFIYLKVRKSKDFEPQIKAKLANLVSNATNGLYKLDVEHIVLDITSGSVSASNVHLQPDSIRMEQLIKANQLGNDLFYISLKKLNLEGLSPKELLDKENIDLDKLVLDSPEIRIVHKERTFGKKDSTLLSDKLVKDDRSYSIGSLLLQNIKLTVVNIDKNKTISSFKNLSALLTDIKVDSVTKNDSSRFLFAKDAVVFVKGFSQTTAKKRYNFNIDSVAFRPQHGMLQVFDIRLKPVVTKDEFSAKLEYQQDMYDIHLKKGIIKNVNWFSLLSEDGLYGEQMTVDEGKIKIYHDRRLPGGPAKRNNFPHQLLMGVDFPVSVKKLKLENMFLSYEELNPNSGHTGIIEFHDINGTVENLTNIPGEVRANPYATIKASAKFMNEGKLDAGFTFDLAKVDKGIFAVDAELGAMSAQNLNKITEGLALIKVKSVEVNKVKVHIDGNNNGATGKIAFAYDNLSFDVLKKNDEGDLKKRGLFTLFAKIVTNNDSDGKQHIVTTQYDPHRSFFNLIWQTILAGIMQTVK